MATTDQTGSIRRPGPPRGHLIPAAMYVRMSTEHQQYSTENQADSIRDYALEQGFNIIETFADEGRSGLNIAGRESLQRLIARVASGQAHFNAILVYDVSRWGRFQDADESAYYEYICKRAGIKVHFCAEQFKNDGSTGSTIIKSLKRAMASEYSRELSAKVFVGQCRLVTLGFRQGGMAGFGLRRMLIDHTGNQKGILQIGELKSIQTDRVILVPGPEAEVETVRWMYQAFIREGMKEGEIARTLNTRGSRNALGRPWTRGTVQEVLSNEKYIGNNLYNRISFKLKEQRLENTPETWIRRDGAFEGIVEPRTFAQAREIRRERRRRLSDEEMLERLRGLYQRHGRVCGILIDEDENLPSAAAYRGRFGGLLRAYHHIGYTPQTDTAHIEDNRRLRKKHPELLAKVIAQLQARHSIVEEDPRTGLLHINQELKVALVLCRCTQTPAGRLRWKIRLEQGNHPDLTIAVRMNPDSQEIRDYYLLPSMDMSQEKLRLAEENGVYLDIYRQPDLSLFYEVARRATLRAAA